jgi:pimeloyl-ACP methyl ester carboxylesterase
MSNLPWSGWRWSFPLLATCFAVLSATSPGLAQTSPAPAPIVQVAPCTPEQLHIFIIHGWDALDLAKLKKMSQNCQEWGFPNVHRKQFYHRKGLVQDVAAIRAQCPNAQFAFIGFSAGACTARDATVELHDKYGIDVRLLVYLGGNFLGWRKTNCPSYVERVVHVRSWDDCILSPRLPDAETHTIPWVWHFSSPRNAKTVGIVQDSLHQLVQTVPAETTVIVRP